MKNCSILPRGVRDIYNLEWKKKDAVIQRMRHVLSLYGYQDITTPTFEYFDVFNCAPRSSYG